MPIPAACEGIQQNIGGLEAARATLQETLSMAPSGQKPFINTQISKLTANITDLEDDLADCIVANTTIPTTPSLTISWVQVIQAIQTPGEDAKPVAGKRTGVRVFVTSGLPGGAPFPPGTGVVPNVSGTVTAKSVASQSVTTLQPLNAGGVIEAPSAAEVNLDRPDHALLYELPDGFIDGIVELTAQAFVQAVRP
jgi:hypothetical protein